MPSAAVPCSKAPQAGSEAGRIFSQLVPGEEERKEGEEREIWKEIFEGGGHERKRRRGEETD